MFNSRFKNDSSQSPGFLFIKAYNNWYTEVQKALRVIDLTHPQFIILTVTAYFQNHGQNPTQKTIADHSSIDVMTTSQILRLLEKKQYIQRKQHPTDTRAKSIILLDAGREKVNQGLPLIEKIDGLYFGGLQSDLPGFMNSLHKLCSFKFSNNKC
ncbi:MAG: transcriptional regulator, MarR family [Firmicutes bacterium]|nr:transcriptional regulator, MarR family [Bacillota bacterium]